MTLIAAGARHTVAAVCVAALFASSLRAQLRPGEVEAVPMPIPDVIDSLPGENPEFLTPYGKEGNTEK